MVGVLRPRLDDAIAAHHATLVIYMMRGADGAVWRSPGKVGG
jgi:hypothetical protein